MVGDIPVVILRKNLLSWKGPTRIIKFNSWACLHRTVPKSQRDLKKLKRWAITNHMEFNEGKYQIPQLEQGNSECANQWRNKELDSNAMERDLGVLVSGKFGMSQWCAVNQEAQP
ncbi:hypothetical protein TURU_012473 [Turdus rufiventris]|nr:hypothetical protein TURU_012473 [Turdus rufiventris]